MNRFSSIIKADFLQRSRSYSFLVTLLVSVYLAYTFLPPDGANYSTVRLGNFVGYNNAAWIGHVTAIMASTFLWLLGFYLVNNSIKRDEETGVGQIIATTSITNFQYLIAKLCSNFLVLSSILLTVFCMAIGLLIVRGDQFPIAISQFIAPFVFIALPNIFLVSGVAIVSEVFLGKYRIIQQISFFFLYALLISSSFNAGLGNYLFDVFGTKYITDGMQTFIPEGAHTVSVGYLFGAKKTITKFLFEGTTWSLTYLLTRLFWMGVGIGLVLLASKFFDRFSTGITIASPRKRKAAAIVETIPKKINEIELGSIPNISTNYSITPMLLTEFRMLLRKGPKWMWMINIGAFVSMFFIPIDMAHQIGLPIIWFLQVNRWGDLCSKEVYHRTEYFAYSSYKPIQRLLLSQIVAAFILTLLFAVPIVIRLAILGNTTTVVSVILGAGMLVLFAALTGIVFGNTRFFEVVFFFVTYLNVSEAPFTDYFGSIQNGYNYILIQLMIILFFAVAAFGWRSRVLQRL